MRIHLAPEAEADLESIWLYVATESASNETADTLIDRLLGRLSLLPSHPYLGRSRTDEFGPGTRSLAAGEYVIVYAIQREEIQILRIVHGRRDLYALFDI